MLPLLPALILLLLQGPSNVERLAHEGRLPAALQAVHATLARPVLHTEEQRKVLEHLLAVSSDAQLTRALAQLLTLVIDEPAVSPALSLRDLSQEPGRPPTDSSTSVLPSIFLESQRSRDGPGSVFDIRS